MLPPERTARSAGKGATHNKPLKSTHPMSRLVFQFTIEDVLHIPPDQRAAIIATYPAHEREARVKGVPCMGSGRVFPITRVLDFAGSPPRAVALCAVSQRPPVRQRQI